MTMKALYKTLMAFAASLLLVPAAHAQSETPYYIDPAGFGFNKYVVNSTPNAQGEYTLRIETFATGTVEVKQKAIPSDIVLVLDGSGSMGTKMYHPSLKIRSGNSSKWNYSNTGAKLSANTCVFIRYPDDETGKYYRVDHGHAKVNGSDSFNDHWVFFKTSEGETKYIYGSYNASNPEAWIHDEKPADGTYPAEDKTICTGPLYVYPTRNQAVIQAVKKFVDLIKKNNDEAVQPYLESGKTGNQICVIQYVTNSRPEGVPDGNTKVLIDFTPVDTDENVTAIKNAVGSLVHAGNTPHDAAMKLTKDVLDNLNAEHPAMEGRIQTRLRTVVFFTDGTPAVSGVNATLVRKQTTDYTYAIKNNPDNPTKIFSIAFAPPAADATFLKYVSSNYPDGKETNTSGTPVYTGHLCNDQSYWGDDAMDDIYYMDAGDPNVDMNDIFSFIAENVGGGSSATEEGALMAVDMVSSSFQLPLNADASRVQVYTAQCLGTTGETITDSEGHVHDVLAFAEPVLAKTRGDVTYYASRAILNPDGTPALDPETGEPKFEWTEVTTDIDDGITAKIDKSTNTVSISGFDYENLWCGYDPKHENAEYYTSSDPNYKYHVSGYRGFKIIIEFPIVIKDGATGGPSVLTNLTSSGLYQVGPDGERTGLPIFKYPQPKLPIPINLWIEKRGLKYGESASFTILRKLVEKESESDPEPQYERFTQILMTGKADGQPVIIKLLSLDPKYYYKIWEEGWAWAYSNQAQDLETAPTTQTVTNNKIVITNTYDDPDIKHAEAKATNKMRSTESTIGSSTETVPAQ